MKTTIGFVVLIAAACGGQREGGEARHDDHHDHEPAEKAAADENVLRVDHEMLRDLRVTTAKAEARTAGERVFVLGELEVNQDAYAEVGAPVPARVLKILVGAGATVKAGDPLVELHSPELSKARAEVQAARSRQALAAQTLTRKRGLAAEKLVTARELQEASAAASTADAELRVAMANLDAFGPNQGDGARFVLRAPIGGTVIERTVVQGQLAEPAQKLFRIGDLANLWLTAHVFERDAMRVKPGGDATVTFAALPGRPIQARIAVIGHEVHAGSRTVPVRLDVANPDRLLRPGMSATVALPLGDDVTKVVAVPLASVQRVADRWVVFLPRGEEGVFDVRAIGRGRKLGGEVEVLSGLAPGEVVVVDGAFLLKAEADKARGGGGEHDHH